MTASESTPDGASAAGVGDFAASRPGRWLPSGLAGARLNPGRRGVIALVVVAIAAAAVSGIAAWRARPQAVEVRPPAVARSAAEPSSTQIVVSVAGKVRAPGLVRLPPGARVADAIAAAGGALPGTDLGTLNLARKLVDGELVVVGAAAPAGAAVPPGPPGGTPGSAAAGAPDGARLDLNQATAAQLDALPGVGPVLAQRIVDFRTGHGGFRSVDQLREVDGIGETRYQRLKDLVTV